MKLVFNITRFEMQYPAFIRDAVQRIVDEELLKPIKFQMKAFNYSQKIIDGTTIENLVVDDGGFVQFDVVSEYDTESGFDVALAREEGTRTHFVAPRFRAALSWIANGIRIFSKGHWVRGIRRSNVIQNTIAERFPILQARLNDQTDSFFNSVVNS